VKEKTTPVLYVNISHDPLFKLYISKKDRASTTIESIVSKLKIYNKYIQLSPSELIQEAREDQINQPWMSDRQISLHFVEFIQYLKNGGKAPGYITNIMKTVKAFYRGNGIAIPDDIQTTFTDPKTKIVTDEDIPTRDDIKKALTYANKKYQAIILLASSSGMGSAELRSLTVGKYLESLKIAVDSFDINEVLRKLESVNEVPTWDIIRIKTGKPYITFSSPESCNAINEYLKERSKIKYKNHTIKPESALFPNGSEFMKESGIPRYFRRLNNSCGFGYVDEHERTVFFHCHGLRKFFISTLSNHENFDHLMALWLTGHSVESITDTYVKINVDKVKAKYVDVLPEIVVREMQDYEIKDLKDKIVVAKSASVRIKQLEDQNKSLLELMADQKEQFATINNRLNAIERINAEIYELKLQISDTRLNKDKDRRRELIEQKRELNEEKLYLMAKNNPELIQKSKQRKINFYLDRIRYHQDQIPKAINQESVKRHQNKVREFKNKLSKAEAETES
jgi:integrase